MKVLRWSLSDGPALPHSQHLPRGGNCSRGPRPLRH
jgi:hypothetical protein